METLSELGQGIRRLTNLAYPTAPGEVRETLAKDQFIDALIDSDIRIRIKQSRPANLNEAISCAVELEAYNRVEKRDKEFRGHLRTATSEEQPSTSSTGSDHRLETWMKSVEEGMKCITDELRELKTSRQRMTNDRWYKDKRGNSNRQDRGCYECGKPGHIKRYCPLLNKRPRENETSGRNNAQKSGKYKSSTTGPRVSVGLGSSIEECGLYVDVKIQGETARFLVDTGATVTLVSESLYKKLPMSVRPNLHEVTQTIMTANSTALSVHGKAEFNVCIDQMTYYSEAIVAKLKIDGFLGLDFMKAHQCSVDIGNEVLVVNGREKRLSIEGFLGCYRITASKTVSIPPRSEMIVPGKVCVPEGSTLPVGESIIEPLYNKCRNECALTARTIVSPNETVPVRLMNTDEDAKVVHSGTVIGQLSEVAQVEVSLPQVKPSCTNVLRTDLTELLQKTEQNLTSYRGKRREIFL